MPLVGRSMAPHKWSSVDLPQPDGPDEGDEVTALERQADARDCRPAGFAVVYVRVTLSRGQQGHRPQPMMVDKKTERRWHVRR